MEVLLEAKVALDFSSIEIAFDKESAFSVPRLDNFMRFKGSLSAALPAALDPATVSAVERALKRVWPEILSTLDIPIGDRLTEDRNEIRVVSAGLRLQISFDLIAD